MSTMRSLSMPQVRRLLPKLPLKYRALVAIGVTTGCRISEILSLRRFDLLTREGKIKDEIAFVKLKAEKKTGKSAVEKVSVRHRNLAIPENWRKYIIAYLRAEEKRGYDRPDDLVFRGQKGKPLSRLTVWHFFREKLGEKHGTHWMRKTFAQEMYHLYLYGTTKETGDHSAQRDVWQALESTRVALGHARIDTTIKYLGFTQSKIIDAQRAIFN